MTAVRDDNRVEPADIEPPASGPDDELLREPKRAPRLPPRWFIRAFWVGHRAVYSLTRGRLGLSGAKPDKWGMLRLTTVGRRTGVERSAILGYLDDGSNFITLAMNGWADPEPAWWLNLQANPDARVELATGPRYVRGREADGTERARLWARWAELDQGTDGWAAKRSRPTAVVVLEPLPDRAS